MSNYQATAPTWAGGEYGGLGARLAAFLVDCLAIGALISVVTLGRPLPVAAQATEAVNWHNGLETLVGFAYFTLLWSWIGGGQTVGMRLFGLRLVGADGRAIGYLTAVGRWVGFVISAAVLLLGLMWVAFDPRRQGWHDKLAGTFVVRGDVEAGVILPMVSATNASSRPHPVARGFAVIAAALGGSLGLLGFALALAGDARIAVGPELWIAGSLAVVSLIAAIAAWWRPGIAALAMALVIAGYWLALGALVGPWWDAYNVAVANPVTEQRYWAEAPAMAAFITSAIFVALAAAVAWFGAAWPSSAGRLEPRSASN